MSVLQLRKIVDRHNNYSTIFKECGGTKELLEIQSTTRLFPPYLSQEVEHVNQSLRDTRLGDDVCGDDIFYKPPEVSYILTYLFGVCRNGPS